MSSSNDLANAATPWSSSTSADVVEVDADLGQRVEGGCGGRRVGVDRAGDGAVVEEGLDRLLRHRVDRVRADELVDVGRVGVGRVLRGRRGPQRSLHPCAPRRRAPPSAGPGTCRRTAGRPPGPGPRRPVPRSARAALGADLVEAAVDLGVDPRDEEAGHARDAAEVALGRLEAGEVRLHHLGVAVEAEDQRDVDAAALGDHRLDRRDALGRAGDLHVQVRARRSPRGAARAAASVPARVAGQVGGDLDRHVAVDAVAAVVDGPEEREGAPMSEVTRSQ